MGTKNLFIRRHKPWHSLFGRMCAALCIVSIYLHGGTTGAYASDLPITQNSPLPTAPASLETQNVDTVKAVPPQDTGEESMGDGESKVIVKDGPNGKITYVERAEDSQLFLEFLLDDKVTQISPDLSAYLAGENTLIPLGKFSALVGFPITVDTGRAAAEGWFLKPDNTFKLVAPYKYIEIAGKHIPVKQGLVETHLDDIYVSLDLLSNWFPLQLTLKYNELRLYMKPLQDLPFQQSVKRHERWQAAGTTQQPGLGYDPKSIIYLPYRMYSPPALEISHGWNIQQDANGNDTTSTSHNLNGEGDLLGMDARYGLGFFSSSKGTEQLQNIHLTLSKDDLNGNLLGGLHATHYALGDISSGSFPLAGQQSGRGATVDNEPYNFVRDATQFRIQGIGPANWDIEIFQGAELLAFGKVAADGRYDFPSLPLSDGFNLFRITFYGPNGEKEERYERFYLGQNMVGKGNFIYNVSALESSTPLLDVSAAPPRDTAPTFSAIGEYGINDTLSVQGGYYHAPQGKVVLDGIGTGVRASSANTYVQLNTFLDKSGGQTSGILMTGNITDKTTFNLTHTLHNGFTADYYSTARTSTAQVSHLFDFEKDILPDINFTVQGRRERNLTGQLKTALLNRVSTGFAGLTLSNELERDSYNDTKTKNYDGRFIARYRAAFGTLHGQLNYNFYDNYKINDGSLSLQQDLNETVSVTMGLNHTFGITPATAFNTAVDVKSDKSRVSFSGALDSKHAKQVGVTLTYNLVPNSLKGDYSLSGRSEDMNTGRLLIRPYIDLNGNGLYEANEPLVKNAVFRNSLRSMDSIASGDGLVLVPGLSASLANRISVNEKSLSDIYLKPVKKELVVLGKAGVNGPIDFAFSKNGSINGKLEALLNSDKPVTLSNVHIALINTNNKTIADTYSEFDGYFSLDAIPLGTYQVVFPQPEQLGSDYHGSNKGPSVTLTLDKPEITDILLQVKDSGITIRAEEDENTSRLEPKEPLKVGDKLGFFDMRLNQFNPMKSN